MQGLTDNQEKYVEELIKGKSQREAFRIAYPKSVHWKDNVVDVRACELFKQSKIKVRYDEIHDRIVKEAEDECVVSAKEVLRELKKVAFADMKDFLSYKTCKTKVGNDKESGEPIIDYATVIDLIDSEKIDGKLIKEVSINSNGTFSFKLQDKMAALDKLGKYLGLFADKVEIDGKIDSHHTGHINLEGLSEEELRRLARVADEGQL